MQGIAFEPAFGHVGVKGAEKRKELFHLAMSGWNQLSG